MATIKELKEQIQSVNALGRANLSNAGIDLPETATTYDIMQYVGLPDWDDDSPIIASKNAYGSNNTHWELTEKGTMRWIIDYPSTSNTENSGLYANSSSAGALLNVCPEIIPYLPKIKQVYVPDGITRTEFCFMVNCERVRIPDSLTSKIGIVGLASLREFDISHNVFSTLPDYYCSRMYVLEKVILNDSLTTISRDCFSYCYSLKDINLENITTFRQACFNENMNLTQITFSAGLVSIEAQAFRRTGLTSITFQKPTGQPPTIASNAFEQCLLLKDIFCPWAEAEVAGAPWGATNATIHYNTQFDENGNPITE